jgi:hypothetical protein
MLYGTELDTFWYFCLPWGNSFVNRNLKQCAVISTSCLLMPLLSSRDLSTKTPSPSVKRTLATEQNISCRCYLSLSSLSYSVVTWCGNVIYTNTQAQRQNSPPTEHALSEGCQSDSSFTEFRRNSSQLSSLATPNPATRNAPPGPVNSWQPDIFRSFFTARAPDHSPSSPRRNEGRDEITCLSCC